MEIDFGALLTSIGLFGLLGFMLGWLFKMFMKIAASFVALYIASLYWLEYNGVIEIHKEKLFDIVFEGATNAMTLMDKIMAILPAGGMFAVGFILGATKT